MSYANGIQSSHTVIGMDLTGGANVDIADLVGPDEMDGRVSAISAFITTAITVAASTIDVGTTADPDGYAFLAAPVQVIDTVIAAKAVDGALGNRIPAGTPFEIGNSGGSTAGIVNVTVFMEWS